MNSNHTVFNPLVSIVIPVYRGGDFLAEAIDSALAQTYKNIEVIVVNDGSDDAGATDRVALSYGDRIRYYSKPNGGVATALNKAIEEMHGEYFSWLSHDDLYTADKVAAQVLQLARMPEEKRARAVLYSNYAIFTTDVSKASPVGISAVPPQDFRYWITIESALHGCTLLIPKKAFLEVGLFDPSLRTTQDYALWFKMAKHYAFYHVPKELVFARSHAQQGSIALSHIARQECNALFASFVAGLEPEELTHATNLPLAVAYAKVTRSLWYRGFWQAGLVSANLACAHFSSSPMVVKRRVAGVLINGVILYVLFSKVRPFVPPYLRRVLRNLLSRSAAKPAPVSESAPVSEGLSLQEKFAQVYEKNIFRGSVSRSGEGSNLVQTEVIRREIPQLVQELGVRSFLDAPCGDWYWMQHVDLPVETYTGLDIVEALIAKNQQTYANHKVSFQVKNLAQDTLPAAELIFSRDCLVHLALADALKIIANFKRSGATYLLTTTFVNREANEDLGTSFWRPLNMELAPFHFPPPLKYINEGCTEGNGMFADKCLGLWRLADISTPPDTV